MPIRQTLRDALISFFLKPPVTVSCFLDCNRKVLVIQPRSIVSRFTWGEYVPYKIAPAITQCQNRSKPRASFSDRNPYTEN